MSASILEVQGLRLRRGSRDILSDVSLDVERGELVALMGPSGSGKTTILRVVAALESFQAGSIRVDDVMWRAPQIGSADVRRLRTHLGMVFQFHCLFEHLTAIDNVVLAPVHAHRIAAAHAAHRARQLLDEFGVLHRAGSYPRELSGGEAQRVAIARALAVDPALLLMDEPTASLDPERRADLGMLLRQLVHGGHTLLVATHDEEFARAWATRILKLTDGRIVPLP